MTAKINLYNDTIFHIDQYMYMQASFFQTEIDTNI